MSTFSRTTFRTVAIIAACALGAFGAGTAIYVATRSHENVGEVVVASTPAEPRDRIESPVMTHPIDSATKPTAADIAGLERERAIGRVMPGARAVGKLLDELEPGGSAVHCHSLGADAAKKPPTDKALLAASRMGFLTLRCRATRDHAERSYPLPLHDVPL